MSLATKKIKEFVSRNYQNNEAEFLRDAVAFLNDRAESHNQKRHFESLLLDFVDSHVDWDTWQPAPAKTH